LVRLPHDHLGHARGKRLPQPPDRLADLRQGRIGLGQMGFKLIQPAGKALMELIAQILSLSACTDVI
jgi:hypothetical protein